MQLTIETSCNYCGQIAPLYKTMTWDGKLNNTCGECATRYSLVCGQCGELAEKETMFSVRIGKGVTEEWCIKCTNSEAVICDYCGEPNDPLVPMHDISKYWLGRHTFESWCPDCAEQHAVRCSCCDEEVPKVDSNTVTIWSGYCGGRTSIELCERCIEDYYVECEGCGVVVNEEEVYNDETDWGDYCYYCPDCHDRMSVVQPYGKTVGSYFWLDDGTRLSKYDWQLIDQHQRTLFLGVELETDQNDDRYELARDIIGELGDDKVECKQDSSLHCEGLEIVSYPMTPAYHLQSKMWEKVTQKVRKYHGLSHDAGTCGLHIHLSRSFFDDHDAVYRLDQIFHQFSDELVKFSRRGDNLGYARIDYGGWSEIQDVTERKTQWEESKRWNDRFQAVNDKNDSTVEIRLWRGSLNMETIRATIELTTGLAYVVNSMENEEVDKLDFEQLVSRINDKLEENDIPHEDLDSYMVRIGLSA